MGAEVSTSVLQSGDVFSIGAVIIGLAWLGTWLDITKFGQKTSGVVWIIVLATLLSNLRILPLASPVYDFVGGYLVTLSIPLLLFKANIRQIFSESGPVMLAFTIASFGVVLGALLGYFVLDLGDAAAKIAGTYTGAWIGGAVNFVAVSQAVELSSTDSAIALSASSVTSVIALMIIVVAPSIALLRKFIPSKIIDDVKNAPITLNSDEYTPRFRLPHVAGAIAASFAICTIADLIASKFEWDKYSILIVTILAILLANIFPKRMQKLEGDVELGILAMYIFFAVIGATTDAMAFLKAAPILLTYGLIIMIVHFIVVLIGAKLFKLDLAQAITGSAAAFVGAGVTAAITTANGWRSLITPGILCGVFGYVIATFIGVAITSILGG